MTNQFTDKQVEAGALAAANVRRSRYGEGPLRELGDDSPSQFVRDEVRAALEAAAGAAPQSPRERTPEFESREQELFKHQPLLSMNDGGIAGCKCMDRVFYGKTEDWGTHLAEVFDDLAPVQPSSTIDEGKLADQIQASRAGKILNEDGTTSVGFASSRDVARAVIAHLEGKTGGGESR